MKKLFKGELDEKDRKEYINKLFLVVIAVILCIAVFILSCGIIIANIQNKRIHDSRVHNNQKVSQYSEKNPDEDINNLQVSEYTAEITTKSKAEEDTKLIVNTSEKNKVQVNSHNGINSTDSAISWQFSDSKASKVIYRGVNKPQVAITFDDGYNKKSIEKVLDTLKKHGARSTFFIIGKLLDDYPDVWKRAINEGHQICNHTNNHQILTELSEKEIEKEILDWEKNANRVLGKDYVKNMKNNFPFLRLPGGGGAKSKKVLSIADKSGYTVIGWNLETFSSVINPSKGKYSDKEISDMIEKHVLRRCSNGSIILFHFNKYDTENIDSIISGIINKGYNIQLLDQMIK